MKQWFLIIGFLGLPAFILFSSILFLMYDWNGVLAHIGKNLCGFPKISRDEHIHESYSNKVICRQPVESFETTAVNKFLTRV